MKFGNTLLAKRASFPANYAAAFLDYGRLKLLLKQTVASASLATLPHLASVEGEAVTPFDVGAVASRHLATLAVATKEFFLMLDEQVAVVSAFYETEEDRLLKLYSPASADQPLAADKAQEALRGVQKLESYAVLNLTGVAKILKKYARLSGAGPHIAESYMMQLTRGHRFYHNNKLAELKASLLASVAGVAEINLDSPIIPAVSPASHLRASRQMGSTSQVMTVADGNGVGDDTIDRRPSSSVPLLREGKTPTPWFPPAALLPSQRVLITMSGPHGTDIIAALLECISKANLRVDDFSFARLHHHVTFAVLVQLPASPPLDVAFVKDLTATAKRWNANLLFDAQDANTLPPSLEDAPYDNRVKYTATVLNQRGLTPAFLNDFTKMLLTYRISVERMARLNSALAGAMTSVDYKLSVPRDVDVDVFRADLFALSRTHGTDVSLQEANVFRRSKRLVVFDMDSTLIQQEVIDEIARHAGVVDKVAAITESAMRGEIAFAESLRRRVALLKGTPATVLDAVRATITFNPGARELCRCLKKLGYKLAVISGGFIPLANYVKAELGLDYAFANQLRVGPDGKLTGETIGPIVTGERKAELLEVIAQAENITPEQVIAVGDGANDLWMLAAAGLGIAFNAKPKVQERARTRINQNSLTAVLYLLGYSDEDVSTLMNTP
ncbi:phosphoserine phosphatase SerB [Allomyces macrogynus ATCC 38327]|uniref:phosphoserine phosphatase n=1 Tax=Allomyces macrogynus (strain ATCC 38327) TaxID=578462 RepID=A0A0L0SBT4_ALLM3|nr:phosphoserine phosphatase SerB [Allomyces macrogynus ATCC 38327]|eukprot:KNE59998.1 phosphoserine phosphatase SerB [Allomyces macrogynus ATCC 38327]